MSDAAKLVGIARVIPLVETFVTPIFATAQGARVVQTFENGRVTGFAPVATGAEFCELNCGLLVGKGHAVVYGFETSGSFIVGCGLAFVRALRDCVPGMQRADNTRRPTIAAVERFIESVGTTSFLAAVAADQSFIVTLGSRPVADNRSEDAALVPHGAARPRSPEETARNIDDIVALVTAVSREPGHDPEMILAALRAILTGVTRKEEGFAVRVSVEQHTDRIVTRHWHVENRRPRNLQEQGH